jgi:hypothetical protein
MKSTPIEKFQYLTHLKATNVHLFYRLLSQNIKVRPTSPNIGGTSSSQHRRNSHPSSTLPPSARPV